MAADSQQQAPGLPSARNALIVGSTLGAAAGAWAACADYGALWLWLPLWRDRLGLLVRLLAALAPVGALLGALVGLAVAGSLRVSGGRAWRAPLPAVLLSALPLRVVA